MISKKGQIDVTTDYGVELAERADDLASQGKHEQADEVMHIASLAGYSGEEGEDNILSRGVGGGGKILADVKEQKVEWLWDRYIPCGRVTMIYGTRGSRKSTLLSDLAARVSRDGVMPNGDPGIKGAVVMVSAEEDTAETLLPRLKQFGADLSRISVLSEVEREATEYGDTVESAFKLPDDLGILRAEIKRVNAILVVLDPLHAIVSGKISLYRNQSARGIMESVQALAKSTGCAIIIAGHFVKGAKKDLLDAAGGSGGIVDFVRIVHAIMLDPSNPGERSMLINIKNNLTVMAPQMVFKRKHNQPIEYVHGELPSYQQLRAVQKLSQARQNILALLTSEAPRLLNSAEISQRLDLENPNVRYHLSDMAAQDMIANPSRGMYTIHPQVSQDAQSSQESQSDKDAEAAKGTVLLDVDKTMILANGHDVQAEKDSIAV